jgi:zinc transporter 7
MVSRRNRTLLSLAIFLGVLGWNVAAAAVKGETGVPVGNLSAHEIEEQLQVRQPLAFLH